MAKSEYNYNFWIQIFLNILWSVIFFGFHSPGVAFFELLMLWFAIIFLIINFYRVSKTAGMAFITLYSMGFICRYFKPFYLHIKLK